MSPGDYPGRRNHGSRPPQWARADSPPGLEAERGAPPCGLSPLRRVGVTLLACGHLALGAFLFARIGTWSFSWSLAVLPPFLLSAYLGWLLVYECAAGGTPQMAPLHLRPAGRFRRPD